MKKKLFEELKQSLREAGQIKRGTMKPSRAFKVDPQNDIAKVRGQTWTVTGEVCQHHGHQRGYASELGTRPSLANRSRQGAAENCDQTSRTITGRHEPSATAERKF